MKHEYSIALPLETEGNMSTTHWSSKALCIKMLDTKQDKPFCHSKLKLRQKKNHVSKVPPKTIPANTVITWHIVCVESVSLYCEGSREGVEFSSCLHVLLQPCLGCFRTPILIGDTSSNGRFFHCHLTFHWDTYWVSKSAAQRSEASISAICRNLSWCSLEVPYSRVFRRASDTAKMALKKHFGKMTNLS